MRVAALALLLVAAPAAAQSGLDCVADALGGADRLDALTAVTYDAVTEAPLDGEDRRVRTAVTVRPEAVVWETGRGEAAQTIRVTADSVVVALGGGTNTLPNDVARRARQAMWLHLPALWMRRAEVAVEGDCDGILKLTVPDFPEPLVVQLGEVGRPRLISTFRQRAGERVYLAVRYGDYRETDGVWLPRQMAQAEGGVERGVTRLSDVALESGR